MAVRRQASFSYLDKAESTSVIGLYVTEAALDAENATGVSDVSALQTVLNAMTLSSLQNRSTSIQRDQGGIIPTNDAAYNGNKLTVYMKDLVTNDKYHFTIPAVDPAAYNTTTGTRNVPLTIAAGGTAQVEALVTELEASTLSKDGNAVSVVKIKKSSAKQGG